MTWKKNFQDIQAIKEKAADALVRALGMEDWQRVSLGGILSSGVSEVDRKKLGQIPGEGVYQGFMHQFG